MVVVLRHGLRLGLSSWMDYCEAILDGLGAIGLDKLLNDHQGSVASCRIVLLGSPIT